MGYQLGKWALVLGACGALTASAQDLAFTNFQSTPAGLVLEWAGAPTNAGAVIQYRDSLADEIWRIPAYQYPFPATAPRWTDPAATNASRFYRVLQTALPERGKVLSASLVSSLSTFQLQLLFSFAGVPITPKHPVRIFKVVYETVTPNGQPTVASGALCLPDNAPGPLPIVSYQHGTIVVTNEAPSSADLTTEVSVGVGFATRGYAAVVPDYVGLGVSPGLHPYHHARSQATAGVDLLRAALVLTQTNSPTLNNRVFLCGYSQGGHATLALLRELEWFHTAEFTVAACAPMAGAYDLSGTAAADFLSGRPQPNPYYFLYLLAAYQEVYRFADSLADLLAPPYSTTLPPLLNGATSGSQINSAMPADPVQILKPELLQAFRSNPRHPLRLALEDNDVFRWQPAAPLRFYHCAGDRDVLQANSIVAVDYLKANGRPDVTLIDPLPTGDHGDCATPSMLGALQWFDQLR